MLRRNPGIAASSCVLYWRLANRESNTATTPRSVPRRIRRPAALGEHERRGRDVDRVERINLALDRTAAARRVQRVVGNRERDLVDDDEHARDAYCIDPAPKRPRTDQHRGLVFEERPGEATTVGIALGEYLVRRVRAQDLGEVRDVGVRRAEHQRVAARGVHERAQAVARGLEPRGPLPAGIGQVLSDVEDALLFPVERRRRLQRHVPAARLRNKPSVLVVTAPRARGR